VQGTAHAYTDTVQACAPAAAPPYMTEMNILAFAQEMNSLVLQAQGHFVSPNTSQWLATGWKDRADSAQADTKAPGPAPPQLAGAGSVGVARGSLRERKAGSVHMGASFLVNRR
jgi:hypothetical protein